MTIYSRVSDMSIDDDVLRVSLYKKVLDYLSDSQHADSLIIYEIKEDESGRPDLMANRVFYDADLRWLVMLVAGIDDENEPLPAGYELAFPPLPVIRRMIREVRDSATS